ncbi:MAG: TolC family protein [Burkholderiaceae bacterium]
MTSVRLSVVQRARRRLRGLAGAAIVVLLAGCASFSEDGRFGPVVDAAKKHTGQEAVWARTAGDLDSIDRRVTELLTQPLTADSAVQVALLNNRGLQATYQELGIAEAELVQASRLPNPGFSFARLKRGSEVEYERTFSFDLGHLIALPFAAEMEGRRIEAIQRSVAMEMLQVASEARKAYYNAIGAEQSVRYMTDVKAAADAGAELARRLAQAGNINKLQQAREHGFYSEAVLNLARAYQMRTAARERLARALGLWGNQLKYTLPDRLPDLPKEPADQPDIEQLAMAQRLDVQAGRLQAESSAKHLGLSKVTRFINVLEVGYEYNTSNEEPRQTGWEVSVEIPLFDFGTARLARAEATYMQAVHRAAKVAVDARSEVREAYDRYRATYDIARHYRDDAVPTAKRISDENLLRYNGMLIGVFDLLADARAQIGTVNSSIEALRDFWVARADLDMALIGKPSLAPPAVGPGRGAAGGAAPH